MDSTLQPYMHRILRHFFEGETPRYTASDEVEAKFSQVHVRMGAFQKNQMN